MSSASNFSCVEKSPRVITNHQASEIHAKNLMSKYGSENSAEFKQNLIKNAHIIARDNLAEARNAVSCNYFKCKKQL